MQCKSFDQSIFSKQSKSHFQAKRKESWSKMTIMYRSVIEETGQAKIRRVMSINSRKFSLTFSANFLFFLNLLERISEILKRKKVNWLLTSSCQTILYSRIFFSVLSKLDYSKQSTLFSPSQQKETSFFGCHCFVFFCKNKSQIIVKFGDGKVFFFFCFKNQKSNAKSNQRWDRFMTVLFFLKFVLCINFFLSKTI